MEPKLTELVLDGRDALMSGRFNSCLRTLKERVRHDKIHVYRDRHKTDYTLPLCQLYSEGLVA